MIGEKNISFVSNLLLLLQKLGMSLILKNSICRCDAKDIFSLCIDELTLILSRLEMAVLNPLDKLSLTSALDAVM